MPNLVVGEPVVPELLQEAATPAALAEAILTLMADPTRQRAAYARVREALGPPDSLQRNADWVLRTVAEQSGVARALGLSAPHGERARNAAPQLGRGQRLNKP